MNGTTIRYDHAFGAHVARCDCGWQVIAVSLRDAVQELEAHEGAVRRLVRRQQEAVTAPPAAQVPTGDYITREEYQADMNRIADAFVEAGKP